MVEAARIRIGGILQKDAFQFQAGRVVEDLLVAPAHGAETVAVQAQGLLGRRGLRSDGGREDGCQWEQRNGRTKEEVSTSHLWFFVLPQTDSPNREAITLSFA